jgi:LacI family transcriptional regulator
LQAIADRGMGAPDDVAVVGFDDVEFADYLGLTTVAQPLRESGRIATELLLSTVAGPEEAGVRKITLPVHLVERKTT